jgi:arylformamidase
MPFYPGDPGAEIKPVRSIEDGHVANLSELELGSHTGTHIDAPRHFEPGGTTVDDMALDTLVGPARVVDLSAADDEITRAGLESAGAAGAERVLLKTRNSSLWSKTEFSTDYVALSPDAADYLVESGIKLVGIDYLSIERFHSDDYHVHHALLGAGIVILEGIDLSGVSAGDYELICLPLKIRGGDGAPARAVLVD